METYEGKAELMETYEGKEEAQALGITP